MAERTELSLVIRTVDRATAGLRRINDRIRGVTRPVRRLNNRLRAMGREAGLGKIASGFRRVNSAAGGVLRSVGALTAGVTGLGIALKGQSERLADLGRSAERIGIGVDALAQLRFAAEQSGAEIDSMDQGLVEFNLRLSEARRGTGTLFADIKEINPELLKQVTSAKSTEEAFLAVADAMAEAGSQAERTDIADKMFGGEDGNKLINLLSKGRKGVRDLMTEFEETVGSQEDAVRAAVRMEKAFGRLKAAIAGPIAAIVEGLAPAMERLAKRAQEFVADNRDAIARWARDFGEKLPGRIDTLIEGMKDLGKALKPVWDLINALGGPIKVLAALIAGKLVFAIAALGKAIMSTPIGIILTGVAAWISAFKSLADNWRFIQALWGELMDWIKAKLGDALGFVRDAFLNFTPLGLIIKHWEPIKEFFGDLWDGITGIFQKAWDFIGGIIDKILDGVDHVKAAATILPGIDAPKANRIGVGDVNLATSLDEDIGGMRQPRFEAESARPPTARSEANVKVRFENAPRGTRADQDPQDTADVDLSLGYQMQPAGAGGSF